MAVTPPLAHPGVYIQELPSGVRTVVGVPTSITAFMGRAPMGPINEPTTVNSFADYERAFGGLSLESTMSYAVRDFFVNGGGQAIIVRLYKSSSESGSVGNGDGEGSNGDNGGNGGSNGGGNSESSSNAPVIGTATGSEGAHEFWAASPGAWANQYKIVLTPIAEGVGMGKQILERYNVQEGELFDVSVYTPNTDPTKDAARETINNVMTVEGTRRIDRVLEQESSLIRAPKPATGQAADSGNGNSNRNQITVTIDSGADSEPLEQGADYTGSEKNKTGVYALEKADLFNLLCIPPDSRDGDFPPDAHGEILQYCVKRRAMLIVDPPIAWAKRPETAANSAKEGFMANALQISGPDARNAALYFPRVVQADPLREGQPDTFPACGMVAGVMARTDGTRGVWKAPAGIDASLNGIRSLQANLTDAENGQLNPLGINCLRTFPTIGPVIWGARTMRGADQLADDYKYVPVRRLALFIEETLYRSTQWAVFEPNDEPLWSQLRLNIGVFMHDLFRQGAFQGQKPSDAYFVQCDSTTTTQSDINKGIVNIIVGYAPLKPAEFVVIYLQQMAGNLGV